ncbi:MAG: PQQ-binding-like beta-propeller repeat protein [Candidatus Dormibacter sp.]
MSSRFSRSIIAALGIVVALLAGDAMTGVSANAADWPKYLHDNGGSGTTGDVGITASAAGGLKPVRGWPVRLGDRPITTQPVAANGLIYVGAWDGYEYALHPDGSTAWRQYLGRTKNCFIADAVSTTTAGTIAGVVSTAAIASTKIAGGASTRSVLYVGGGGNLDAAGGIVAGSAELIALDALTGDVLWRSPLGAAPNHLIWSSPAVYQGSVYVGVSSFDDCPLVQGKLVKLDASSGALQATFNAVPAGCEGASIWGSPTIDEAAGTVYVATGNSRSCSVFGPQLGRYPHTKRGAILLILALLGVLVAVAWPRSWLRIGFWLSASGAIAAAALGAYLLVGPTISINRAYSVSLIKLDARDLHVITSWKVPASDQGDYDFGSTPTLFSGTVTPGGTRRQLLGIPNKNGTYYVFDRADVTAGPVAAIRLAHAPRTDPTKGNGSVAPSAFDGHTLFIAGGGTEVDGQSAPGSLAAYDPNDFSRPLWKVATAGPVLGAVTTTGGVVVIGNGVFTTLLASDDGHVLFQASVQNPKAAVIFGAATIAGGRVYQGDTAGNLYAYGVDGR